MEIDVEKIMEEIRKEIREKGYVNETLKFEDVNVTEQNSNFPYDANACLEIISGINGSWSIPWYRDLGQGGVKGFVKKVIRKLVTFLIAPIAEDQTSFNAQVTRGLNQVQGYIIFQDSVMKEYKKDIERLEGRITRLENENKN